MIIFTGKGKKKKPFSYLSWAFLAWWDIICTFFYTDVYVNNLLSLAFAVYAWDPS